METAIFTVRHEVGLHARPATLFVQAAMAHQSEITVKKDAKTGNAKSFLSILGLGVRQNDTITVTADGPDEKQALAALAALIENNFGE
jgi:phosphocarrier protein